MKEVHDIFTAAFIWQKTGDRPTLRGSMVDGKIKFCFSDAIAAEKARDVYVSGGLADIQNYVERYKILRAELYVQKG